MAKIIFFGTPEYVVPILDKLAKYHEIVAVVTQPPKPAGRDQHREFSPVDTWAYKKHIPVYFESSKIVKDGVEADLGILESYGEFIPSSVINYFKYGIINAHPSLLPKWRGASPVPATILSGDKNAGVAVIKLDSEWDHGPILSSFTDDILPDDTSGVLRERLFERSGDFLVDLIPSYLEGKVQPKEQDHKKATFTSTITKEEAFIPGKYLDAALQGETFKGTWKISFMKDLEIKPSAPSIDRFVRAMLPWPGAWTLLRLSPEDQDKRLKILRAHIEDGRLFLDTVQLEGKGPVTFEQFKEGYKEAKFV